MDRPIGIFDSGVGGLTVMRALADLLPNENLVYLGDTARVPYGNRGAQTIKRYSLNAARFLVERDIKALVIACNTATAYGLGAVRETFPDLPVIGVVDPVAKVAASLTKTGVVGVIGTRGTISSGSYEARLTEISPEIKTVSQACPLLVPLAEEGWLEGPVVDAVLQEYLGPMGSRDIDVMILGCTHYPILRSAIESACARIWEKPITILDSASATAEALRTRLHASNLQRIGGEGRFEFLATDDPRHFGRTATTFFQDELASIEHVDILDVSQSS